MFDAIGKRQSNVKFHQAETHAQPEAASAQEIGAAALKLTCEK